MKKKKKCFVIMPFSDTPSCTEDEWTKIFVSIIKPAVEGSRLSYQCERSTAGRENLIKGILRSLSDSEVVIADLTDSNPNVFYELGVRHTLMRPTILIAQGKEHIPSDLIQYPTVFYSYKSPESIEELKLKEFKSKIKNKLRDIEDNPEISDSPVCDFLEVDEMAVTKQEKSKATTSIQTITSKSSIVPRTSSTRLHRTLSDRYGNTLSQQRKYEKTCSNCGTINSAASRICHSCGNYLGIDILCPKCRSLIPERSSVCRNCGYVLKK
jgi:hypothetical protein